MKKQIISLICAFALVVSLFAGMGIGLATRVNAAGSEAWTSYVSAEGFNMDTAKTAADISERFSYNSTEDSYTVHSAGWQDYRVSYLYTGNTYENFVLEFDAKLVEPVGQDAWLWLEFGVADPAASFNTNATTGAVLTRIENNRGATPAINRTWGGGYTEAWGSQYDAYDFSAVHHIVLTVNEGKFSLKIDEHLFVNEWAITDYQGGYIGIGSGNNGTVLSNMKISDLDAIEPMDVLLVPESFSFDKEKQTAADSTCFTYNAVTKTYNRELGPDGWQDYNVAYLYTKETYQDFKLEFDVKLCPPEGQDAWLWLEFGVADPAASFNTNAATGAVLTRIENNMETTAIVNRNWGGGYTEGWGAQYDAYNKDNTQHVVLDVKDGKYTLKINDFVLVNQWDLTGYQGGHIGIGTGNKPTMISNITVTPYPAVQGVSLTLNEGVTVDVTIDITEAWLAEHEGAQVVFSNGTKIAAQAGRRVYSTDLTPARINDELTVEIADGMDATDVSVKAYREKALASGYNEGDALIKLIDAALTYSDYADGVGKNLTNDFAGVDGASVTHANKDAKLFAGFSGKLGAYASVYIKVNTQNLVPNDTLVIKIGETEIYNGDMATKIVDGYIVIDEIYPANFDAVISIQAGTEGSSATFTFNSYMKAVYSASTTSQYYKNLAVATYQYGLAAESYVNP